MRRPTYYIHHIAVGDVKTRVLEVGFASDVSLRKRKGQSIVALPRDSVHRAIKRSAAILSILSLPDDTPTQQEAYMRREKFWGLVMLNILGGTQQPVLALSMPTICIWLSMIKRKSASDLSTSSVQKEKVLQRGRTAAQRSKSIGRVHRQRPQKSHHRTYKTIHQNLRACLARGK